jgi:hypothetical protein
MDKSIHLEKNNEWKIETFSSNIRKNNQELLVMRGLNKDKRWCPLLCSLGTQDNQKDRKAMEGTAGM